MNKISDMIGLTLGIFVVIIVIGVIFSLPLMWLWNGCLVPAVNGVNEIGFLQAWGLFILSGILIRTSVESKK